MKANEMRGQKGFSLIEVILAMGLLSIVSVAVGMFFVNTSTADLNTRLSTAQLEVVEQIRQNASSPGAMQKSRDDTANQKLRKCIDNSTPGQPCVDKSEGNALKLLDPASREIASQTGVLYDINARPGCTGTACPFRATTWFTARCRSANCNSPANVVFEIYYKVEKNPSYAGKIKNFGSVSNDVPILMRADEINEGYYPY